MTSKPVFDIQITTYSLSIQLSLNGFSFCIASPNGEIITSYKESNTEENLNESDLLIKVKDAFNNKPELQASFEKVEIIYQNELFTLVPKDIFKEENIIDYLDYSIKTLATDYITHETIPDTDIVNIFIPYININNYLIDKLGSFNYKHSSSVLIESILKKDNTDTKVYTLISDGLFEVIITKENNLLLFNTFTYSTNEDVLYYLLFCMEQLSLSPDEVEVILLSNVNEDLYNLLYTYIRYVKKSNAKAEILLHELVLNT